MFSKQRGNSAAAAAHAAEKLNESAVLKGHEFSRANHASKSRGALQGAEKLSSIAVLKGHGFIRATRTSENGPALAAEGWFSPRHDSSRCFSAASLAPEGRFWSLASNARIISSVCVAILLVFSGAGCKKTVVDPFPASGAIAGWQKTSDTRVFAAKDLWQYIDGDSDQYIQAGVVTTSTSDYNYQNHLEAVVDIYTMGDSAGAHKILVGDESKTGKSAPLGDEGVAFAQSVTFRKGPFLVRIVAYSSTPDSQQALLALTHGVEAKL